MQCLTEISFGANQSNLRQESISVAQLLWLLLPILFKPTANVSVNLQQNFKCLEGCVELQNYLVASVVVTKRLGNYPAHLGKGSLLPIYSVCAYLSSFMWFWYW